MRHNRRLALSLGTGSVLAMLLAGPALAGQTSAGQTSPGPPAGPHIPQCEALTGLPLTDGTVEAATPVAAGATVTPDEGKYGLPIAAAFCRVQIRLSPTPASSIRVEVWLPEAAAWNGRMLGAGNGGFGSNMTVPALVMRGGVAKGYAAVGSDLGHFGKSDVDASWSLGQPEKLKDYGWRANHLAAAVARRVIAAYYPSPLGEAYFHGCSDGGREALMEAQRFPEDYDAILAGAPAIPWARLATAMALNDRTVFSRPESALPNTKLPLLQKAALARCDAQDGVTDGVIDDPRRCDFDPGTLACTGEDGPDCLTAAQVETVRALYRGPRDGQGQPFFPGHPPGIEATPGAWDLWLTGPGAQHGKFASEFFRYFVHADPNWRIEDFDLEREFPQALAIQADINADSPDLGRFLARGGKLILYHGYGDAAIPPQNTIDYYQRVLKAGGRAAANGVRLFMVPGMSHCLAGPGPNVFDGVAALDAWRRGGTAPERIIATKYDNDLLGFLGVPVKQIRTRPLCPYPKVARWTGSGATDAAENFTCTDHP
ncbi:tannase/feruloyl esterase family alpha/beta hydrolase [Azospirillum sp. B4]|uniref:tannase/feruloyl esterase family alpha/beta hydrolase n=1 Tax=Azospirillum sp. B4 TaxID=95605 RepID=UPI00034D4DF2|nr:tannase/feruloyl esterase family alpha/beta hydrolase [Azospirillum sp. B4]